MPADVVRAELKVVGKSGQIALGKRFVGKTLRMEERGDGTIVLTAVAVIPERQLWTLQSPHRERIARGLEWARERAPQESDLDALVERASAVARGGEQKRARRK